MSPPLELCVLRPEGVRLVTPELADGRRPHWDAAAWEGLVERFPRRLELRGVAEVVTQLEQRFAPHDTAMDAVAAEGLHRALRLSRREAADPRVWRFLAIVAFPQAVRHRWEHHSFSTMRSRFVRPGTRPDSNALSRWWWIAELTCEGADYALTRKALARAPLTNAIFIRSLSFYRPAVEACLSVLSEAPGEAIERTMYELSRWLALVPLEGLGRGDLEVRLRGLLEEALASKATGASPED
jgi:hypothetical protein